ncbi:MAG TPA: 7-cyano-7-deazaguanine synthase [Candidatus Angelobacter sp.]|nr:7-cyano-7-deazaguanine synthase [Candidatus Angelobacter sp.]
MNCRTHYHFDFSLPGQIAWKWRGHDKGLAIPEEPVLFQLNDDSLALGLMSAVDPLLADLLNIAVSVHMADRLALKERYVAGQSIRCHRVFDLILAVDDCKLWGDEQVQQKLRRLLGFLSQDTWNFRFVRRHERRRSEAQRVLFSGKDFRACEVALFSGGLDSLAGTAIQMANSPNKPFIAVSASPTNIHFGRQRRQFRIVANALSSPGTHITFKYCMRGGSKSLQEPSRRTRGFAFLVLGAVTSLAAGVDQLTVHENGFGAINLPYDSSLLGVDLTRAMHPTTLRDFSELISFAFAKPFLVRNDCVFSTKAEMCRAPAASSAASAITDTFSCDRLTRSGHHCGYCTSCLLRQLALENAGLQAFDHDRYLIRLTDPLAHPKPHHLHGLAAMSWQAARLRNCFKEKCSWHALLSEFPELQIAAACLAKDFENVTARLSAVYRQHVDEWFHFSALHQLPTKSAA